MIGRKINASEGDDIKQFVIMDWTVLRLIHYHLQCASSLSCMLSQIPHRLNRKEDPG